MNGILGAALLVASGWCQTAQITGYSRFEHGTHTFDGTHILSPEAIAAASWNIPLGWYVDVEEVGTFRIADRGGGWVHGLGRHRGLVPSGGLRADERSRDLRQAASV